MAKKKSAKKKVKASKKSAKKSSSKKPAKKKKPVAKAKKALKKKPAKAKKVKAKKVSKPVKKAKLKPVKKAVIVKGKPAAKSNSLLLNKKLTSAFNIPSKPVIKIKNSGPPPVMTPKVSKVPPSPVKRVKKNDGEPVIPKEPLPKVIKTFSSKNEQKDSGKKLPPHPNQFSIEYIMHASAGLLFEFISSPSGLSEWFADDVNIRDGNFTFFWDGSTQVARQIAYKQDKLVRFQWEGKPDYSFFEFRIETDDLTNDTSLIVTDFTDDGDLASARLLWDNQINRLRKAIGS